jgi:hypothetical protein
MSIESVSHPKHLISSFIQKVNFVRVLRGSEPEPRLLQSRRLVGVLRNAAEAEP